MPWLACKSGRIHYELAGPEDGPACVLVNGLTQYLKLWMPFRDAMVARGFRVASYDMLGQGHSDKPRLFIETMQIVGRGKADLGDATGARLSKCRTRTSRDHRGLAEPSSHPIIEIIWQMHML